ncbi:capsid protein [Alternaria alternata partitivirus 1]|nr:capsid protein [Alternaria alternata partitivirus 1]
MSYAGKAATSTLTDAGDSAPTGKTTENVSTAQSGKRADRGKGKGKGNPKSSSSKTETSNSKSTPGFAEGNAALLSYGLSLSGYRERILSPFKTDKFFHIVSASYQRLINVKPSIPSRFTYEEFLHCSALQLYQRIENVKFDALGVKPAAPNRIPLPRNLRVFQPIWSILANIGTVDDDELRAQYIPDAVLPDSDDLDSEHDIEGLLSCTLYDWKSSWNSVLAARETRPSYQHRDGYRTTLESNEAPEVKKQDLIRRIATAKRNANSVSSAIDDGRAVLLDNRVYFYPVVDVKEVDAADKNRADYEQIDDKWYHTGLDPTAVRKTTSYKTETGYLEEVNELMKQAKAAKRERITPILDSAYKPESYTISDGSVSSSPGAYGARLHWDPQLWLDYENFVNEVASVAMFSLSMPVETTGTYAWVLPVEKRTDSSAAVFCKLPKASVPTQTWILALLLQSSTLPFSRRSTWYTESDALTNITGLRLRYIQAAIKTPSPVEQYGTY